MNDGIKPVKTNIKLQVKVKKRNRGEGKQSFIIRVHRIKICRYFESTA